MVSIYIVLDLTCLVPNLSLTGAFLHAVPKYSSEQIPVEFASTCHMSPQETSTPSVVSSAPKRRISVRTISGQFSFVDSKG